MNSYKKILWPLMALIELTLLLLNWFVAIISPRIAERFYNWNQRVLPDADWYNKAITEQEPSE